MKEKTRIGLWIDQSLRWPTYQFCKTTGTLDSETKAGPLAKRSSVLGYDQVGHIPGNAQSWAHMVKPGVWGIKVNIPMN